MTSIEYDLLELLIQLALAVACVVFLWVIWPSPPEQPDTAHWWRTYEELPPVYYPILIAVDGIPTRAEMMIGEDDGEGRSYRLESGEVTKGRFWWKYAQ